MKCPKCGFEIESGLRFCPGCGTPVAVIATSSSNIGSASYRGKTRTRKLSNLALVSIICVFWPIMSPVAFICGLLAIKKCKQDPGLWGYGLAMTACIVSGIEILILLGLFIGAVATGQM